MHSDQVFACLHKIIAAPSREAKVGNRFLRDAGFENDALAVQMAGCREVGKGSIPRMVLYKRLSLEWQWVG